MANKKGYVKGLGGLKVVHSDGDQEFAKTRYLTSEPGIYTPPASMVLGTIEQKEVAPEAEAAVEPTKKTTKKQDAAVKKAAKNDLTKRNLNNA